MTTFCLWKYRAGDRLGMDPVDHKEQRFLSIMVTSWWLNSITAVNNSTNHFGRENWNSLD